MRRSISVRPVDAVIAVMTVLVVLLAAYVGYSIWNQRQLLRQTTPASRAVNELVVQVRANPNNLALRMQLAQALSIAGRDKEAVRQYESVLKINETYVPALSGIGFIAMKQQDWSTGEKYFRRIVGLLEGFESESKTDPLESAYFYLGTALMEQGQYEEAAQNFTNSLRIRRDASDTHYALAVTFQRMGNEKKYQESLENALLFDPKMPEANYDLGALLLKQGDVAAAAEHFRAAADAAPTQNRPKKALAQLGDGAGRLAQAKSLASTNVKKALVEARVAAALMPDSLEAQSLVGKLFEKTKKPEEALAAYEKALRVDPMNKEIIAAVKRVSK